MWRAAVLLFAWSALTQSGVGETLLDRHGAELRTARARLKAASFAAGAGTYEVSARVSAVVSRADGSALVKLQTGREWDAIEAKGEVGKTLNRGARELTWHWPAEAGPVPVCRDLAVNVRTTPEGEVLRVGYCCEEGKEVRARRKLADGRWELVLTPMAVPLMLRVQPVAVEATFTELRWTRGHGLMLAAFDDGAYGADAGKDFETAAMRRLGWPMANVPGERILPGRDGWIAWQPRPVPIDDTAGRLRQFIGLWPAKQWLISQEFLEAARQPLDAR